MTLFTTDENFIEEFIPKVEALVTHQFISKSQADFLKDLKQALKNDEVVVLGDFSEYFTFIVQDSAQGLYFRNKQATIHPFVCYFKDPCSDKLMSSSFVVISDFMKHGTSAVYAFQRKLMSQLKNMVTNLRKVFYFSDGSSAQYKNRNNVTNVWFHFDDFGVDAEWHFFATSHGKSPCDGVGGTVKRLVTLYCLQHTEPGTQITDPERLSHWAVSHIQNINFLWVSSGEVTKSEAFLETRFKCAKKFEGIRQVHAILPVHGESCLIMKKYSAALEGEKRSVV